LLDAKSIWYEYLQVKQSEDVDDQVDKLIERDYGPGYFEDFLSKIDKTTGY
jgi:hypothetical protein